MANRNKEKVYTYNDWWEGKICLIYSSGYFENGIDPILVSWESIVKQDIPKIKAKQKEYFVRLRLPYGAAGRVGSNDLQSLASSPGHAGYPK